MQLGQLYFIIILLEHLDDGRKSDRTCRWIL